jgi:hypothetical protein
MVLIYQPPNADFVDIATQRNGGREKDLWQKGIKRYMIHSGYSNLTKTSATAVKICMDTISAMPPL